jgi:hypothetical protein
MKGKSINARTRIKCPLCGALGWESCFEKDNSLVSGKFQYSPGFRQIKYSNITDLGFLTRMRGYLIQKIEKLYERLTGVNIQKLLERAGGDVKYRKSSFVMEMPVSKDFSLKTVQQLSKKGMRVSKDINPKKIGIENITK